MENKKKRNRKYIRKSWGNEHRKRKLPEKTCTECSAKLVSKRGVKLTCSSACATARNRRLQAQRNKLREHRPREAAKVKRFGSFLWEDLEQEKKLAELEGRVFDKKQVMRKLQPWKESISISKLSRICRDFLA